MNPLEACEIRKAYSKKEVLKGLSIQVRPGETTAILGQNGAGKTTAIKIFSGLLQYDSGQLLLFGADPFRSADRDGIKRRIGYVGQDSERSAYARLTAEENLLFFGMMMGLETRAVRQRMTLLAKAFQFEDRMRVPFMKLSGGQKQTMVIMRALLHDPELLFLDEPTKGLDPVRAREIRLFLRRYIREQGKSLLLTSHILADVELLADRVAFMKAGRIAFIDTPANACALTGYTDILEVAAGDRLEEVKTCVMTVEDARILSESPEGHLVIGTDDFFRVVERIHSSGGAIEFQHRKVGLEDAYLLFAQTELDLHEGEERHL